MPALARLPHDMTWQGKHPSLAQCDAAVLAPRARIAPQVVGFFMDKNKKYKMTAELTEASLATFAAGVEDGTAPVEYKSAPVPEEGEDKEGEVQVRGAVATALHCTAPHWLRCINLFLALLGLMPFAPQRTVLCCARCAGWLMGPEAPSGGCTGAQPTPLQSSPVSPGSLVQATMMAVD